MKEGSRIKTKPNIPWSEDAPGEAPKKEAESGPHHGPNGTKLTIMTLSQILAYEDDPADLILKNGYLEKGSPCVLCGPPGVGKSRLAMQLAIMSILGLGFIGWETQAMGLIWLLLQSENGQRRLKHDLKLMTASLTKAQLAMIERQLLGPHSSLPSLSLWVSVSHVAKEGMVTFFESYERGLE